MVQGKETERGLCTNDPFPDPCSLFQDDKELRSGDSYELRAENNRPTTTYKCIAINCVGSALSEATLRMETEEGEGAKERPEIVVGLNDQRRKIGTEAKFYVKGEK